VKEQLRYLLQLQTIDAKVKEIEAQIKSAPSRIEPARRDLAKLEAMLVVEKTRLTETETLRKQQQDALEREQESLKNAKSKLNVSKTGKEFNAATREIDNKKKSIHDREAEIKTLRTAETAAKDQTVAHEKDVDTIRQSLAADETEIAERVKVLREEQVLASTGREAIRVKVDKELLKIYESLQTKRGYSVAPVVKGVCQGCHTSLPPQMNNMLARGETVERCPRCLRIVYRPEALEDVPTPTPTPEA
jgi:predicted  nucleic acid-binding Zn-ribbon protein